MSMLRSCTSSNSTAAMPVSSGSDCMRRTKIPSVTTVTRVAERQLGNGTSVLVLHAVDHDDKPVTSAFVRAKILRGMHLMQPVPRAAGKTNFTFTQQINAGGIIPAWLMNALIAQDAVQFVQRLGKVSASR